MKRTKYLILTIALMLLLAAVAVVSVSAENATIVDSGYCGGEGNGRNLFWTLDSEGILRIAGQGRMQNAPNDFTSDIEAKKCIIEEGVTEIGDRSLYGLENCEIYIPSSVNSIVIVDNPPFGWVNKIIVDEKNTSYMSRDYSLYSADMTTLYYYYNSGEELFTVPEGVIKVNQNTFRGIGNLKHLVLSETVAVVEGCGIVESLTVLNPECMLNIGTAIGTVYGYIGSTAQIAAEQRGLPFVALPCRHNNTVFIQESFPNCITVGYTAGVYCYDCDTWIEGHEEKAINPNNHVNQKDYEAVDFTCTMDGYTSGVKCEDCGKWLSGHDVIRAHHTDKNKDTLCDICGQRCAYVLKLDEPLTIDYASINKMVVLFTPNDTGFYRLTSEEVIHYGFVEIVNKDGNELNSVYVNDENLTAGYLLQANETYTISIRSYQTIGSLTVTMTKEEAPSGMCGENVHWTLDESGTLTINGTGEIKDYDFVTSDEDTPPWFGYANCVETVIVNDGVTHIGAFAFFSMPNVTNLLLSNTLESIGIGAFAEWEKLQKLVLPTSVALIDAAAFANTSLQQITVLNPDCLFLEVFTYTDPETGETEEHDIGAHTLGEKETTICGYPGSTAEAYASKYERTFIALGTPVEEPITEIDMNTGITVTYGSDTYTGEITLSVIKAENSGNYLVKSYEKTSAWDITTLVNGVETQPIEPVTVSIPVPAGYNENTLAVYHVNNEDVTEKVEPITVKDGKVSFAATSFSIYIVVDESSEVKPHTYTAAVTTDPTCSTDGETTYTCTICGDTYTEPIPATGEHADADNDGYCDTCEEMMQGGDHCKFCGKIHGGLFGWLVKIFHSIFAIFKR